VFWAARGGIQAKPEGAHVTARLVGGKRPVMDVRDENAWSPCRHAAWQRWSRGFHPARPSASTLKFTLLSLIVHCISICQSFTQSMSGNEVMTVSASCHYFLDTAYFLHHIRITTKHRAIQTQSNPSKKAKTKCLSQNPPFPP